MGDIFDGIVALEEKFVVEGARAADADARAQVLFEADEHAWGDGLRLGLEIGFYRGCLTVWLSAPSLLSQRCQAALKRLSSLLDEAWAADLLDPATEELMLRTRQQFRLARTTIPRELLQSSTDNNNPWFIPTAPAELSF